MQDLAKPFPLYNAVITDSWTVFSLATNMRLSTMTWILNLRIGTLRPGNTHGRGSEGSTWARITQGPSALWAQSGSQPCSSFLPPPASGVTLEWDNLLNGDPSPGRFMEVSVAEVTACGFWEQQPPAGASLWEPCPGSHFAVTFDLISVFHRGAKWLCVHIHTSHVHRVGPALGSVP